MKVTEQRITFVLLEVYRNIQTCPTQTATRTKDSCTKKFAATLPPFLAGKKP